MVPCLESAHVRGVGSKVGKSSFESLLFLANVFLSTFFREDWGGWNVWQKLGHYHWLDQWLFAIATFWTNDCDLLMILWHLRSQSMVPCLESAHVRGVGSKIGKNTIAISWTIDCDLWMIFFQEFQITINGVTFGSSLTDTRKQGRISETPAKVYLLFQRRQFREFCLNCLYWVFRWIFIPWNLEARIAHIGNFHQLVCCLWPFDDKLGISGLCYTFVMFQIILQVFLWLLNIQESEENLKSHLTLTNRSVFCSLQTALLPFIPAQAIQLCLDLNCLHWALRWLCNPRNPLVILVWLPSQKKSWVICNLHLILVIWKNQLPGMSGILRQRLYKWEHQTKVLKTVQSEPFFSVARTILESY